MDSIAYLVVLAVLGAVATARLTRLVTYDRISDPVRLLVVRRLKPGSMLEYLIHCAWCMSIWIGALVALFVVAAWDLPWELYPLLVLFFSYAAGALAAKYDTDEDDIEIEPARPLD